MNKLLCSFMFFCLALPVFSSNNLKNPVKQFTGFSRELQPHFTTGRKNDTANTYCNASGLSSKNEYIKRIVIGTIDNTSGNNEGYGKFTSVSTSVTKGQSYTLKVQAGFKGPAHMERWIVFIDYNGDGDFDDEGEKIGPVLTHTTELVGIPFKISITAKTGITRMRVLMQHNAVPASACGKLILGEVEDYSLNIVGNDGPGDDPGDDPDGLLKNVSVYPNPAASSFIRLKYDLTKSGNVSFKLSDTNGMLRGKYNAGVQVKGANSFTINDLSSFHNGYYYLSVEQDGKIISKTIFMIQH